LDFISLQGRKDYHFDKLAILAIICLFGGFFFSRVLSNVGVLFGVIYLLSNYKNLSSFVSNKWFWTFIGIAILPLLTDIFHHGSNFDFRSGVLKFLILFYPLFLFSFKPKKEWVSYINRFIILLVFISSLYSLAYYYLNHQDILLGYNRAKVMKVLAYGDHIRLSWLGVISMILAYYEYNQNTTKRTKIYLLIFIAFQFIFLHILMAKTGLLMLYMAIGIFILYNILRRKKYKFLLVLPLMLCLPMIAYFTIPSFKQRADFIRYDFGHYSQGKYRPGLSDALRYYSIKSGIETINNNTLFGVGYSHVIKETNAWYTTYVPEVPIKDQYLPSNQYIIYWAAGGLILFLILMAHVLMPFFDKNLRQNIYFLMFFVPAIASFTFETHLEGQASIFIYAFFTCWFWNLAEAKKEEIDDVSTKSI
jgi:hypothetical protein